MNPLLVILKAIERLAYKGDLRPVLYRKQKEENQIVYVADEEIEGDLEAIKTLCTIAIADFKHYFAQENKP